jgi:hydroxyacylglutathione hydrolase
MLFRQLYHSQLAQASYLIGCQATGEALVVDPLRDIEQYLAAAEREGLRITAVTETHIHADFVSGARELAERTGATLYLSDAGPADWKYAFAEQAGAVLLRDRDQFMVGNIRVEAWHTPGHTPEHLVFVVTDTANADAPIGVCTGDLLFVGDVGRPDLLEKAAGVQGSTEQAALNLYSSLQRVRELPEFVQIWPGHGAGSACGRALGAVPQSTLGYELRFNWAFAFDDAASFAAEVLRGQPAPPRYFAAMKRVNKLGPDLLAELPEPGRRDLASLAQALSEGVQVVDLRPAEQYQQGHVLGSINLPFAGGFQNWAGWLLDTERAVGLIGSADQVAAALVLLQQIGIDRVVSVWDSALVAEWPQPLAQIAQQSAAQLEAHAADFTIIDVRNPDEHAAGSIAQSLNIPLSDLRLRLAEIPSEKPIVVHCAAGTRSAIAASVLRAAGFAQVIDLAGGFAAWQQAASCFARAA